jgi:cation transport ATPase
MLSLILMVIFSTGKFPPLFGAVIQEVVDVVVIFNALRAHMIRPLMVN